MSCMDERDKANDIYYGKGIGLRRRFFNFVGSDVRLERIGRETLLYWIAGVFISSKQSSSSDHCSFLAVIIVNKLSYTLLNSFIQDISHPIFQTGTH